MVSTVYSDHVSVGDNNTCSCNLMDESAPASPFSIMSYGLDESISVDNFLREMNILSIAPGSALLSDDHDVVPHLTAVQTRTLTITTCYTENAEADAEADVISDICSRRVSMDRYSLDEYSLDDYLEESCGSTLLTRSTAETCLTNPTDIVIHELTPIQMVKIPVSRLRQLEYIEKHLSSIVQSAVDESVI
jgi:hypothetical protein